MNSNLKWVKTNSIINQRINEIEVEFNSSRRSLASVDSTDQNWQINEVCHKMQRMVGMIQTVQLSFEEMEQIVQSYNGVDRVYRRVDLNDKRKTLQALLAKTEQVLHRLDFFLQQRMRRHSNSREFAAKKRRYSRSQSGSEMGSVTGKINDTASASYCQKFPNYSIDRLDQDHHEIVGAKQDERLAVILKTNIEIVQSLNQQVIDKIRQFENDSSEVAVTAISLAQPPPYPHRNAMNSKKKRRKCVLAITISAILLLNLGLVALIIVLAL